MRPPVIASNRCLVSASRAAAPETQIRIDLKSTLPCCTDGWLSSAIAASALPLKKAGLTRRSVATRSGMSRGFGTRAIGRRAMMASAWVPTLL